MFGLISVTPTYSLAEHLAGLPTPQRHGEHPGNVQLIAADSISGTDEIKIGRNESIRANRIDHHAPRSFNVNLERRNRADVVEIDVRCHAIHVTVDVEHTIPKENGVAARPI